jgi:hypothetical protein
MSRRTWHWGAALDSKSLVSLVISVGKREKMCEENSAYVTCYLYVG